MILCTQYEDRLKRLMVEISGLLNETSVPVNDMEIRKGKIKFPCKISELTDNFAPYSQGQVWSDENFDNYVLFKFNLTIPKVDDDTYVYLNITTNKTGGHNMVRPQMMLVCEDEIIQGLDVNHEYVRVNEFAGKGEICFYVYAYSGLAGKTPYGAWVDLDTSDGVRLYVNLCTRKKELADFYHNIKTPYAYLQYFEENSYEYQKILNSINDALAIIDLRGLRRCRRSLRASV